MYILFGIKRDFTTSGTMPLEYGIQTCGYSCGRKGAGGCVITHSPLTPTARVQLPVAL